MTVSDRLRKYCEEHRITQISLVDKGFGSAQTVNNYINGNTEPKANFLEKFIKEFRVSALWLMTGQDETPDNSTYKSKPPDKNSPCQECIEKQKEIDFLKKEIALKDELLDLYRNKKEKSSANSA